MRTLNCLLSIKNLLVICLSVACLTSCNHRLAPPPIGAAGSDGYVLVWADEFNGKGVPDTANWNYEEGFVRNQEQQWYQKGNASMRNGLLTIEARKETKPNPHYEAESKEWRKNRPQIEYTSSCLLTRGKQQWLYGRFECRARIGIDKGMWPAWWTLGIGKPWPANGEIDIMEYYRGMLLANIAFRGATGKAEWFSNRFNTDSLGAQKWASQFHTWRMDWTDEYIALYLDDQLLNKVTQDKLTNQDGSQFNPFRQPHYMLLNLAMGGMNGGDVTGTSFPQKFEVDYVRVYQKR
ncbi:glycoside hydrolase family 16 protein [Paraflavitalea sp. CAU 1676]|uniref:glycoside hydrolase family 16 protein n=1 Tax=Paraflavitalea sp. CAU 1676 TaxID=3032598 RepID=UPI0023DA7981|nr:glycoside hydrolase family 16 protein [Paraflavitalea sp. CAU 1676]MDF2191537.1 glycoside hydrolase family 16 protein [Paraflavitalea sp. CAU 1676]